MNALQSKLTLLIAAGFVSLTLLAGCPANSGDSGGAGGNSQTEIASNINLIGRATAPEADWAEAVANFPPDEGEPELSDVIFAGAPISDLLEDLGAARVKQDASAAVCENAAHKLQVEIVARLVKRATELKRAGPFVAGDEGRAQSKYAYVYGGRDLDTRNPPYPGRTTPPPPIAPAVCQEYLFGFDCSGYVLHCARSAGFDLSDGDTTTELSLPTTWNTALPPDSGLTMVYIDGEPHFRTGDIAIFDGHVGIVEVDANKVVYILSSAGKRSYTCAENTAASRGPTTWRFESVKHDLDDGERNYPVFLGVLRLVPACAIQFGDVPTAALNNALVLDYNRLQLAALPIRNQIEADLFDCPPEQLAACEATARQRFQAEYCPMAGEMLCILNRLILYTEAIPRDAALFEADLNLDGDTDDPGERLDFADFIDTYFSPLLLELEVGDLKLECGCE